MIQMLKMVAREMAVAAAAREMVGGGAWLAALVTTIGEEIAIIAVVTSPPAIVAMEKAPSIAVAVASLSSIATIRAVGAQGA